LYGRAARAWQERACSPARHLGKPSTQKTTVCIGDRPAVNRIPPPLRADGTLGRRLHCGRRRFSLVRPLHLARYPLRAERATVRTEHLRSGPTGIGAGASRSRADARGGASSLTTHTEQRQKKGGRAMGTDQDGRRRRRMAWTSSRGGSPPLPFRKKSFFGRKESERKTRRAPKIAIDQPRPARSTSWGDPPVLAVSPRPHPLTPLPTRRLRQLVPIGLNLRDALHGGAYKFKRRQRGTIGKMVPLRQGGRWAIHPATVGLGRNALSAIDYNGPPAGKVRRAGARHLRRRLPGRWILNLVIGLFSGKGMGRSGLVGGAAVGLYAINMYVPSSGALSCVPSRVKRGRVVPRSAQSAAPGWRL